MGRSGDVARKSVVGTDKQVREAVDEFYAMCEIRYDIAKAAYDAQSTETQEVLDRIRDRLRLAVTGYITVAINPPHSGEVSVRVEQKYIDYNLMYVATEILKDLALFGVQVADYNFPDIHCINCGAEIEKTRPKKRRKVRVT
jgi:hypothetical protein